MPDFAHTPDANQQRLRKAQTLARWCYQHGVDRRVLAAPASLRRQIARTAGVRPPHELDPGPGETWHLVCRLLAQRVIWDSEHAITPPPAASCLQCAVLEGHCPHHEPRRCETCGQPLHQALVQEHAHTHPSCDLAHLSGT